MPSTPVPGTALLFPVSVDSSIRGPRGSEILHPAFYIWLVSPSALPLRIIRVSSCVRISILGGCKLSHPIDVPHFAYSFICWWTFELIPLLCSCEYCCCDHRGTGIDSSPCFQFFGGCRPRSNVAGSYSNSTFNFLNNHHSGFRSGLTMLHCHQQCLMVRCSVSSEI